MAVVHRTTLSPSKIELLTGWLPAQPWFRGETPQLARAGGFRLDDPDGAVGIELMIVIDTADPRRRVYHVPLAYRGAPLPGGEHALVGTTEHGVLGRRWIYDGAHDPVAVAQMSALLTGRAVAQDQDRSDTEARVVTVSPASAQTPIAVRINRIPAPVAASALGSVSVEWTGPDDASVRGVVLEAVPS